MKTKYLDLVEQTFDFPTDEFKVIENELYWNDINMMDIIEQYGTPLRITYLPTISKKIQNARRIFNIAMAKLDYKGEYFYAYCTKSNHFSYVLAEALKNNVGLETSSAFDINIIEKLYDQGLLPKDRFIICNGFKRKEYIENICRLVNTGFENVIPVIDNKNELFEYRFKKNAKVKLGIRIAAEEEPTFEFYTSRLGIRYNDIVPYYRLYLKSSPF